MKYDTARPYAASYVILHQNNKIAFLLRTNTSWMNGYYGLAPSGKVEEGETYVQAAIREAKEEVGIVIQPENLRPLALCHRSNAEESVSWVDMCFEAITWEGEVINAEPEVHGSLEWFDAANLPNTIIHSHRFLVENALAGNRYCEYGWGIEKTD